MKETWRNISYLAGIFVGVPGLILYFTGATTGTGLALILAAVVNVGLGALGFIDRGSRGDLIASGILLAYGLILGVLGANPFASPWLWGLD